MRERFAVRSATRHFDGDDAFLAYRGVRRTLLERNGYRAACLFPGGISKLPAANDYFLPRVDMFPHSDLRTLLGSRSRFTIRRLLLALK